MLLVLPSHRVLFHHGKLLFTLLPSWFQIEEYSVLAPSTTDHKHGHQHQHHGHQHGHRHGQEWLAILHYKTANFYRLADVRNLAEKIAGHVHSHHNKDNKVEQQQQQQQSYKINPIFSQSLPKKMQVMDLFQTNNTNKSISCIISDKFGDIYQVPIQQSSSLSTENNAKQTQKIVFMNSNLGIPRFIKHISTSTSTSTSTNNNKNNNKQYFILADEQNRIKIYNYKNSHEIVSVWFMPNMTAIQCHIFNNKNYTNHNGQQQQQSTAVVLMKSYDKITLQQNIQLHSFIANQQTIQSMEYPGVQAKSMIPESNKNLKQCRYYTLTPIKIIKNVNKQEVAHHGAVVLYLYENKIVYEVFSVVSAGVLKSEKWGELEIEAGKWDYLYAIDTGCGNVIAVAYGADVEVPVDIHINNKQQMFQDKGEGKVKSNHGFVLGQGVIQLNKYEKVAKLDLKL